MATTTKLLNTGVLQTAGEFDEVTLDSSNQGCVYFNGTSSYLTVPTSSFLPATNTYTIEMFIHPLAYPTSTNSAALYQISNANITNYGGLSLSLYGTGNIRFQCRPSTGGTNVIITSLSVIPLNVWTHVAVVVNNGYAIIYINGVQSGVDSVVALDGTQAYCSVGYLNNGNTSAQTYYSGYMSNLRVVENQAIYPDNVALTSIANTLTLVAQTSSPVLDNVASIPLIPIVDNSSGTLVPQNTVIPFSSTYSTLFPGTSPNYITATNKPRLRLTTGDFTIEMWIRPSVLAAQGIFAKKATAAGFASCFIAMQATGRLNIAVSNNLGTAWTINDTTTMPVMTINTWYHIAVVRNGNNIQTYVNGTQYINSTAIAAGTVIYDSFENIKIGANATTPTTYFNGYISNLRVVKGVAVYTGAFTSPTTPLTTTQSSGTNINAITGVSTALLCLQSTSITTDNSLTSSSYIENIGGITSSNSVIPFTGTYSLSFNGSSQYLELPTSVFLESNNYNTYTIEMWIRPSAYPTSTNYCSLFQVSNLNVTNFGNLNLELYANGQIRFEVKPSTGGTLVTLTTTTVVPLNQWTHVAVSVLNGRATLYLNGYTSAYGTVVALNATQICCSIGYLNNGFVTSQTYFNGYISNVRVVKNVALYPTNFYVFTPPSNQLQITQSSSTNIAAITDSSKVGLLLQTYDDMSVNNLAIVKSGSTPPSLNYRIKTPFNSYDATNSYNNGSIYFSGLPARFTLGTANAFDFGTADLTVEAWIYLTNDNGRNLLSAANDEGYFIGDTNASGATGFYIALSNDTFSFGRPGSGADVSFVPSGGALGTQYFQYNTWYHVAVTRSGMIFRGFINGVEASINGNTAVTNYALAGAALGASYQNGIKYAFTGYISNFRSIKGRTLYNSNFTPSTTPLQIVPGTSLLTAQSETGIKDTTGRLLSANFTYPATDVPVVSAFSPFNDSTNVTVSKQYRDGIFKTTNNIDEVTLNSNYYNRGSVLLSGTSQYLSIPVTNDSALFGKNTDFTIEAWLYNSEATIATERGAFQASFNNVLSAVILGQSFGVKNSQHVFSDGASTQYYAGTPYVGRWYHIALSRKNNILQLFIDGILQYSVDDYTIYSSRYLTIGGYTSTTFLWKGFISNLRIVKSKAVYSKSMTILKNKFTTPTSALPLITSTPSITKLLTAKSSIIEDTVQKDTNSISNVNGVTTTNSIIPFAGTYSYQFNSSSSQYLYLPSFIDGHSNGAQPFTLEFWVYNNSFNASSVITTKIVNHIAFAAGFNTGGINLNTNTLAGTYPFFGYYNGTTWYGLVSPDPCVINTWYHFAVTFDRLTTRLFINGVLKASVAVASMPYAGAGTSADIGFYIGRRWDTGGANGADYFNGYLSNIRFIKGQALYTSAFTPPTAALTEITTTNPTKLLTAQSATIIDNSPRGFALTNPGGAVQVNNSIIPFAGTYSYYFNGSAYLNVSGLNSAGDAYVDDFIMGTDDFTIELWVYPTVAAATSNTPILVLNPLNLSEQPGNQIKILQNVAGLGYGILIPNGGATDITQYAGYNTTASAQTLPLNTWSHLALVRVGTSTNLYYNGTLVCKIVSTYDHGGWANTAHAMTCRIGYNPLVAADGYFQGYISNLRIVKGVSVYSDTFSGGNFTPPTNGLLPVQPAQTNISAINAETAFLLNTSKDGFEDISNNRHILQKNGTLAAGYPTSSYRSPFISPSSTAYYSAKFNGTNNYVNVSTTPTAIGTSDFTIECFIYITATSAANRSIYDGRPSGSTNSVYPNLYISTANLPIYFVSNAARITGTALNTNRWYHIAIVRISSVTKMYVDGVQVGAAYADSNSYLTTAARPVFGADLSLAAAFFPGYISNLRVVVGTGVYTGPFILPTSTLQTTQSTNGHINAITAGQTKLLAFTTSSITTDTSGSVSLANSGTIAVDATDPPLALFLPSTTSPTIVPNTTLMKQYRTGELKVLNYIDEYAIKFSIIPDRLSLNEGSTVTFSIICPQFGSGTLYWTNSGTTVGADFSDSINSGSITITSGVGTLSKTIANDASSESVETVIIQLRTGSISGPVVATSSTIIVNDNYSGQAVAAYPTTVSGTGMVNIGTGTFNWTCPAGVTSVSVVCVGGGGGGGGNGGGGGGGGGLAYINNYTVVPGNVYPVVVGVGGTQGTGNGATGSTGGNSYFNSVSTVQAGGGSGGGGTNVGGFTAAGTGGLVIAGTGGAGGAGGAGAAANSGGGGGGAGGYYGSGGVGGIGKTPNPATDGLIGSGGGAGGGSGGGGTSANGTGGNGGGVGLLGAGINGAGGTTQNTVINTRVPGGGGGAGSNGTSGPNGGASLSVATIAGSYGGGGGGSDGSSYFGGNGGPGAVRIIWGLGRSFPSTNTGDM